MFYQANAFNQPLNNWDVSSVTDLSYMFNGATAFNGNISEWDTSKVDDMSYMFYNADAFNQDIGGWDVSSVTDMNNMFAYANVFNQNIGGWNTSNVDDMNYMFYSTGAFNQDLNSWDTSKVTNMAGLFRNSVFNSDISGWDTSKVQSFHRTFRDNQVFNQPIGNWNTSSATVMYEMFEQARDFNQDISGWDVSSVTNMYQMFNSDNDFNQDLSSWDVSSVTDMSYMFQLTDVDFNFSSWNVSKVTDMSYMFNLVTLSTENYDSLLNGWASLPTLQSSVIFSGGNSQYSLWSNASRNGTLIGTYSWTITDGGLGNAYPNITSVSLNASSVNNDTTDNLQCFTLLDDLDGDAMNVSVRWYKDGALNQTIDYNNTYADNTFFNSTLLTGNTTINETWMCSLRAYDGSDYSSWVNSSNLTIIDLLSPNSSITSPSNNTITSEDQINFTINVSDNVELKNATLYITNTSNARNTWIDFDGENDYVDLGNPSSFVMDNMTISMWINPEDCLRYRGLIYFVETQTHDYLSLRCDGQDIKLVIEDDDSVKVNLLTPIIQNNTWTHILFTQNGTGWTYYNNGVGTEVTGTNSNYSTSHLNLVFTRFGYSYWDLKFFNGSMDEVRIYNRTLNTTEISEIYNAGLKRNANLPSDGLVAWYDFENSDGNATRLVDESGNGNNGTVMNGATFTNDYTSVFSFAVSTVSSIVSVSKTLVEGIYSWFIRAFDWNGNEYNSDNQTLVIDQTNPAIEFNPSNPTNNSGRSDSFVVNVSINESYLANVTLWFDGTETTFNTNNGNLSEVENGYWIFTYNQTGLVIGTSYFYNVTAVDNASNSNTTETRLIKGNSAPSYSLISLTPSNVSYSDIDPDTLIEFNVSVYDPDENFNSSVLQIWNSSGDLIVNNTMTNLSVYNLTTNMTSSFTTNSSEQNYTYRIYSIDDIGAIGYSSNFTLQSFWDCEWNITTTGVGFDLGATGGYGSQQTLGNITINNTGDSEYTTNNCSITFARTASGSSWLTGGDYDGDGSVLNFSASYYLKGGFPSSNKGIRYIYDGSEVTSLIVNASESKVLEIKGYYPTTTTTFSEHPYFPVFASINDSVDGDSNKTISMEMIVTPGAYLSTAITSPSTTSQNVYLTPGNTSLRAYIKDVVSGASNANNTAYNISFNWTIPSGIASLISGNTSAEYSDLNDTSEQYLNLTLELTAGNIVSLTQTNYELFVYGYGYENSSGSLALINHTDGVVISDSVNISFLCY